MGAPHGRNQPHQGGGDRARAGQSVQERRGLPHQARAERAAGCRVPGRGLLGVDEAVLQGRQCAGARRPGAGALGAPRRRRDGAGRLLLHRHRRRHRHRPRQPPGTHRPDRVRARAHGQDQLPPRHGRGHRPLPRQRLQGPRPRRLPDRRRTDQQARRRTVLVQGGEASAVLAVHRVRGSGEQAVRIPAQAGRVAGAAAADRRQRRVLPRRFGAAAGVRQRAVRPDRGEFPQWLAAARARGIVQ